MSTAKMDAIRNLRINSSNLGALLLFRKMKYIIGKSSKGKTNFAINENWIIEWVWLNCVANKGFPSWPPELNQSCVPIESTICSANSIVLNLIANCAENSFCVLIRTVAQL